MKNVRSIIGLSVFMLFLFSAVSYAQEVTEQQYIDAYMRMYGSYLGGDEKFSKADVEDTVNYYLTTEDLSSQLYTRGPQSGRLMGSILADAGVDFNCDICGPDRLNGQCCVYRAGEAPGIVYECVGNEVKGVETYKWIEIFRCNMGCCNNKCCRDPNQPTTTTGPTSTTTTTGGTTTTSGSSTTSTTTGSSTTSTGSSTTSTASSTTSTASSTTTTQQTTTTTNPGSGDICVNCCLNGQTECKVQCQGGTNTMTCNPSISSCQYDGQTVKLVCGTNNQQSSCVNGKCAAGGTTTTTSGTTTTTGQDQECWDGTPLNQCSTTPGFEGYRCKIQSPVPFPFLWEDATCTGVTTTTMPNTPPTTAPGTCNLNLNCESGETYTSCPTDCCPDGSSRSVNPTCSTTPTTTPGVHDCSKAGTCGDNTCGCDMTNFNVQCEWKSDDPCCCKPDCGVNCCDNDGICETARGEDAVSCPSDCGGSPSTAVCSTCCLPGSSECHIDCPGGNPIDISGQTIKSCQYDGTTILVKYDSTQVKQNCKLAACRKTDANCNAVCFNAGKSSGYCTTASTDTCSDPSGNAAADLSCSTTTGYIFSQCCCGTKASQCTDSKKDTTYRCSGKTGCVGVNTAGVCYIDQCKNGHMFVYRCDASGNCADQGSNCPGGACNADGTACATSGTCKDTGTAGGLVDCSGVGGCMDASMGANCFKDQCKSGHNYVYRCNTATDRCVDTGADCTGSTCNAAGTGCASAATCKDSTSASGAITCNGVGGCQDSTMGANCYADKCTSGHNYVYRCNTATNKCADTGSNCAGGTCNAAGTGCAASATCKDSSTGGDCSGAGGCQDSAIAPGCYKDVCKSGHNFVYRCNKATDKCADTGSNCASGSCNSAGTGCQAAATCKDTGNGGIASCSGVGGCQDSTMGSSCYKDQCKSGHNYIYRCNVATDKCADYGGACASGQTCNAAGTGCAASYTCHLGTSGVGGSCCFDATKGDTDCYANYCSGMNLVSYSCSSNKCVASSKACTYGCGGNPPVCDSGPAKTPCGDACSNTGKTYKDYLCKSKCDTWDDHVSAGDSWCASNGGAALCCCNRG